MYKDRIGAIVGILIAIIITSSVVLTQVYKTTIYDKSVGKITSYETVYSEGRISDTGSKGIYVHYKYEYDGNSYLSRKMISMVPNKKPIGSQINVYVNPNNPENTVIMYGKNGWYVLIGLLLFSLISLLYVTKHGPIYINTFSKQK